jgi:hypothetical protein
MRTKKYYSFIAEQFCLATAVPNNPVDHESQYLFLMTLLIFSIEGLFKQIMYPDFLSKISTSASFHVRLCKTSD